MIQYIPRTGTEWLNRSLANWNIEAESWYKAQVQWSADKWGLYAHKHRHRMVDVKMVATFVRHPVSYYESVWMWFSMKPPKFAVRTKCVKWHPLATALDVFRETKKGTFADWVFVMLERYPLWYTRLIESYVGPDQGEWVDWIGRYETISSDLSDLLGLVGFRRQVIDEGPCSHSFVEVKWNKDLLSRVKESESSIIERFYGENEGRRCYASLAQS